MGMDIQDEKSGEWVWELFAGFRFVRRIPLCALRDVVVLPRLPV